MGVGSLEFGVWSLEFGVRSLEGVRSLTFEFGMNYELELGVELGVRSIGVSEFWSLSWSLSLELGVWCLEYWEFGVGSLKFWSLELGVGSGVGS